MNHTLVGTALLTLSFAVGAQQVPLAVKVPHEMDISVTAQMPRATVPPASDRMFEQQTLLQKQTAAINALAVQLKDLEERVKALEDKKRDANDQH
ncbi:MAG: hypothetical protein ABI228_04490 [Burkholderiaceae bacterium]